MQGRIRFFKSIEKFGFITSKEAGRDVFFHENSIEDSEVKCVPNEAVEFELVESRRKPGAFEATRIRRQATKSTSQTEGSSAQAPEKIFTIPADTHPSEYLFEWSYITLDDKAMPESSNRSGALQELADLALKEDWDHGSENSGKGAFPILRNYLVNTFYKQYIDGNVLESTQHDEHWAAFNTGLVNKLYNPIYALFQKNLKSRKPWRFHAFCNANIGRPGQILVQHFSTLPPAPKYFKSADEVVFDPNIPVIPRYDHIIDDSIARDRYPVEFLRQHVPEGFSWRDPSWMSEPERSQFLQAFTKALKQDPKTERNIHNRLDDAIDLAVKRARWNYQTAIPLYFPRKNSICLLLPISLVDDGKVDLALIVSRTISGGYSGETVYPLNWAYEHARLVCKPDGNWLTAASQEPVSAAFDAAPTWPSDPGQTIVRNDTSPGTSTPFPSHFIYSEAPAGPRQIKCPHCQQVYSIAREKLTDLPRGATCKACGNRFMIHPE